MSTTPTTQRRSRWSIVGASLLVVTLVGTGAWIVMTSDSEKSVAASPTTTDVGSATPLRASTPSVARDAQFLSEVTEADPALATYERTSGNVALRSLLTDGSAFCGFLQRDRDMDTAMVSVVVGARHVEAATHLPMTVITFNAVDAVALLTLCPSLQSIVPTHDLVKIRALGAALAAPAS
ncbi:MAG: hypothetical protein WCF25_01995 [Acidimicrobiales bacterium]